jgi:hypothetical protein
LTDHQAIFTSESDFEQQQNSETLLKSDLFSGFLLFMRAISSFQLNTRIIVVNFSCMRIILHLVSAGTVGSWKVVQEIISVILVP